MAKNKNKKKKIVGFFDSFLFDEKKAEKQNGILVKTPESSTQFLTHEENKKREVDLGFWDINGVYHEQKEVISERDI